MREGMRFKTNNFFKENGVNFLATRQAIYRFAHLNTLQAFSIQLSLLRQPFKTRTVSSNRRFRLENTWEKPTIGNKKYHLKMISLSIQEFDKITIWPKKIK